MKDLQNICSKYPRLPEVLSKVKRIIAIGDLHGDYQLAVDSLKIAKIIDDKFNWIAEPKETIVVQVGDQIDRCRPLPNQQCYNPETTYQDENSDFKILKLYSDLNSKADKYGGKVINLLGNHEIMNVQGVMDYVSYQGLQGFGGVEKRKKAFRRGGEIAEMLACTRSSAVIIGSNIFVHAGIMPKLIEKYGSDIKYINNLVRKWLLGMLDEEKIKDLLNSEQVSPFWPRLLGTIKDGDQQCNDLLNPIFNTFPEINNMIIGHTPQYFTNGHGINSVCNHRVHRIDVSGSKAFDPWDKNNANERKVQVLEIIDDNQFNIIGNDGKKTHKNYKGGNKYKRYKLVKK